MEIYRHFQAGTVHVTSDCDYTGYYPDLHLFRDHIAKEPTRRADKQIDHEFFEGVNSNTHITDGI